VKNLPELDDEFAQLASEFDTIEELREDVRTRLGRQVRLQQLSEARDKALEALLEKIDIPLPEKVVEEEIGRRNQQLEQQLQMAGMSKEDYLKDEEKSEEEFDTEVADAARLAVKGGFVLDQLAVQEELNVENEELSEYVVTQAMQMGVAPQQLAEYLTQNNQLPAIVSEVLRSKALNLVVEHVTIKDESGNVIDVEAVQRELNGETAEAEAEGETAETAESAGEPAADEAEAAEETPAETAEAAAEEAPAAEAKDEDAK
jgi:trigger factor